MYTICVFSLRKVLQSYYASEVGIVSNRGTHVIFFFFFLVMFQLPLSNDADTYFFLLPYLSVLLADSLFSSVVLIDYEVELILTIHIV